MKRISLFVKMGGGGGGIFKKDIELSEFLFLFLLSSLLVGLRSYPRAIIRPLAIILLCADHIFAIFVF